MPTAPGLARRPVKVGQIVSHHIDRGTGDDHQEAAADGDGFLLLGSVLGALVRPCLVDALTTQAPPPPGETGPKPTRELRAGSQLGPGRHPDSCYVAPGFNW